MRTHFKIQTFKAPVESGDVLFTKGFLFVCLFLFFGSNRNRPQRSWGEGRVLDASKWKVTGVGGVEPGPSMSSSTKAGFILPAKLLSEAKTRVSGSFWAPIIPVPKLEI